MNKSESIKELSTALCKFQGSQEPLPTVRITPSISQNMPLL